MANPLDPWHERLEAHFKALAETRATKGLPVFALEHGLNVDERDTLAGLLRASVWKSERLSKYWLPWTVYAAEQGYDYDGDEFWSTFDARTPGWSGRAYRGNLRAWYRKFHQNYRGLSPSGNWATWFSIIAWPITHAILPRDLQHQLARSLYQVRYHLGARIGDPPVELGRYIASHSYDGTSRFRNFLQQEEMVGRIVHALLSEPGEDASHLIEPQTLSRIVEDLQRASHARQWLRETRKTIERFQSRGLAARFPGSATTSGAAPQGDSPGTAARQMQAQIRPRLTLRRSAADAWTLVAELPSLRPLGETNPAIATFLRRTRCSVEGGQGMLPAGWLYSGDQRRVLTRWPASDRPLVKFDGAEPIVDHILQADGRISPGPLWLFRIGPDGLARELVTGMVRPGYSYILVTATPLDAAEVLSATTIYCEDVTAYRLDVPDQLDEAFLKTLRVLNLSIAKSLRVWPVGLPASTWDGEGVAEWLEGDTPLLAIAADSPMDRYRVRLGGDAPLDLAADAARPVFVKLPGLPIGSHVVVVEAYPPGESEPVTGYLSIAIRAPDPWIPGSSGHSGLVVTARPDELTIDGLWQQEAEIEIFGPVGQHVRVEVELLGSGGEALSHETIADITLPMTTETWSRSLATFLRKEPSPWAFVSATSGTLIVDGEALGLKRIPLTRVVSPVRWVWHRSQSSLALRLIDDHEGDDPLTAEYYPFATPTRAQIISTESDDFTPEGAGGLCVAQYGDREEAVVVSARVEGDLKTLLIRPVIDNLPAGPQALPVLAAHIKRWADAKCVGLLAPERRARVIEELAALASARLCGRDWAEAETHYLASAQGEYHLRQLASRIGSAPGFAIVLARDLVLYRSIDGTAKANQFASLADRYKVATKAQCKAALDIVTMLAGAVPLDGAALEAAIGVAGRNTAVLRAARLISIGKPCRFAPPQSARRRDR